MKPSLKRSHIEINLVHLPADHGSHIQISNYHPNNHDPIQRTYLDLVTIFFRKRNLKKYYDNLFLLGLMNGIADWSLV